MQTGRIRTKMLTTLAMLSAIAYIAMIFGRIPVVLFLKYDPKDVIITIAGFVYGPMASFMVSFVVSFVEMLTVSDTGFIGLAMNILSSCAFCCTAAAFYKCRRTLAGALAGLAAGCLLATGVMLLWNYFLTPIYMGIPRQAVAELLIPVFLPFNLLKGGLNAAITMLVYKPLKRALSKSGLTEASVMAGGDGRAADRGVSLGVMVLSIFLIATCVFAILVFRGLI